MVVKRSDAELEERVKGLYEYEQLEGPKLPLKDRGKGFSEIVLGYTDEEALLEAQRCMQCQDPPCVVACPAHLNVPGYIKAIVDGDLKRGLQIIMDTYPLPGSCGRVCFHPCTDVCLKGVKGQPINIPRLRRYLADKVDQRELNYNIAPATGKKVAIIGSGPAGLTVAYLLTRKGHKAIVFEKEEKPGGTLNTIPEYRLPEKVLQGEIDVLRWLGVEIRTEQSIESEGCIDKLLQEYDAVFIGTGAISSWKLDIPGKDLGGTMTALDYLRAVDRGEKIELGRSVAIIGGGNTAMDVLRTAMRQAEEIHFLYRRAAEQMPATGDEVIELGEEIILEEIHCLELALGAKKCQELLKDLCDKFEKLTSEKRKEAAKRVEEEIRKDIFNKLEKKGTPTERAGAELTIHFLTQPNKILGDSKVTGIECLRMELGEPDESGRRRPVPVEGSEFVINADTVIFAIGQGVESSWLGKESGIDLKKWGEIIVDETLQTSKPRVFAGGDAVRGPSSMIEAIADGKRAAEVIDSILSP